MDIETEKQQPWRKHLDDLLAGPYDGYGGIAALSKDIGVTRGALNNYRYGLRNPSRDRRIIIEKLWRKYKLHLPQGER
ncbi:MAG: helix-turn-helix domain-containing protein [Armatimonadota bacterium]